MEHFKFNPPEGFKNVDAFPDPSNELETREQLQRLHDQLADFVRNISPLYQGEVVMLRLDNELRLEYSLDGVEWFPTMSSGHILIDQYGSQLPQRNRLQFVNAIMEDDPSTGYTVVRCSTGEAGPGVPEGGTSGQVLAKNTNNSFDTSWKTLNAADFGAASKSELQAVSNALANKSDNGHNHDGRYYTESESNSLLANKAEKNHTHDDRYYTESETNNLLSRYDTITSVDNKVAAVNNKVNKAAEIVFPKDAETITLASSTSATSIGLFTAPKKGFYFIDFNIEFGFNATGSRFAQLSACTGKGMRIKSADNGSTQIYLSTAVLLDEGQAVSALALQNSGSTLSCTYWCRYSYIPY
jgi:hypothetical protein